MTHDASDLRLDILPPPQRRLWPELALRDMPRFLTCLMTYDRPEDEQPVMQWLGRKAFRHALRHRPHSIMDARSHACWSLVLEK